MQRLFFATLFSALAATCAQSATAENAPFAGKTAVASPASAAKTAESGALTPEPEVNISAQNLANAYAAYKADPNPIAFNEVLHTFKNLLVDPIWLKQSGSAIIKHNPALIELGAKAIDAGGGRVFTFSRVNHSGEIIVQWVDQHPVTTIVGRRRKIKKITYVPHWRIQSLYLPPNVHVTSARVSGTEAARILTLVGDENGNSLWLHAFRRQDGVWKETASSLDSIPSFLVQNVSGKVAFRGSDLIFTVARLPHMQLSGNGANQRALPESDASTYIFLLRLTENGYVLEHRLPDEEHYRIVYHFLQAIAHAHTDVAKSLLVDSKLVSIPRYIGLQNVSAAFHVVQMPSPSSSIFRYRLVTTLKNDLIFDVGRVKDRQLIKGIFIAGSDPFLNEIARNLPLFDKITEPPAAKASKDQVPTKH